MARWLSTTRYYPEGRVTVLVERIVEVVRRLSDDHVTLTPPSPLSQFPLVLFNLTKLLRQKTPRRYLTRDNSIIGQASTVLYRGSIRPPTLTPSAPCTLFCGH